MKNLLHSLLPILAATLSFSSTGLAETFDYRRDMQVRLGETWNPLSPFSRASLGACFESELPDNNPTATDSISESYIEKFAELEDRSLLQISASGSTSFGISSLKVDASLETIRESLSTNRSIVYSVVGKRLYGTHSLQAADLNQRGLDAVAAEDSDEFYRKCGRSIITAASYQSTVSVVYIFTFSNASNREQIRAALSASASYGTSSGEIKTNMLTEARKIDTSTELEVLIFQDGIRDANSSLSTLLTITPGDITAVRIAVKDAIDGITFKNSQLVRFSADPISNFFSIPSDPDWQYVSRAYNALEILKTQSDRIVRRYGQLQQLQLDVEYGSAKYRENMEAALLSEKNTLISQLTQLADHARVCFENADEICSTEETSISSALLQYVEIDFGSFLGWQARVFGNYYDSHGERVHRSAAFWPTFSIKNVRLIRSLQLERNGNVLSYLQGDALNAALAGSELDFASIWESSHSANDYCWRGNWTGCNNWAADVTGHKNGFRSRESQFEYKLVIEDIEGNSTEIFPPNPSSVTY